MYRGVFKLLIFLITINCAFYSTAVSGETQEEQEERLKKFEAILKQYEEEIAEDPTIP